MVKYNGILDPFKDFSLVPNSRYYQEDATTTVLKMGDAAAERMKEYPALGGPNLMNVLKR